MNDLFSFILLFGIFAVAGCSSTRITSTWKAADVEAKPYHKIMVVGIVREADNAMRENMETHLVDDLHSLGYNASSAFLLYGPKAFQGMTEKQVTDTLKGQGIDAVITIVMLDKQRERYYVPGRVLYSPYGYYHDRFWGYYHSVSNRIDMPGYYQVSTNYFWESNLYDLSTQKLAFSVQTKSFDPSSTEALAHEYGKLIIKSLLHDGVLKRQSDQLEKAI